jgi:hypothetical protein
MNMSKQTWRKSIAKSLLLSDLHSGAVPIDALEMTAGDDYRHRSEFQEFPFSQFRDRLRDLRKKFKESKDYSALDSAALAHDRINHPIELQNEQGKNRWEGSEASKQLRRDMECNMHQNMKPHELWSLRPLYYENFPLDAFRKHIGQERQTTKFYAKRANRLECNNL